jgi:hypothetical protein
MCHCLLKCNTFKDKHRSPHYSVWVWEWEFRKFIGQFYWKNLRRRNIVKYNDNFINY